jgi:hypothetical protein
MMPRDMGRCGQNFNYTDFKTGSKGAEGLGLKKVCLSATYEVDMKKPMYVC